MWEDMGGTSVSVFTHLNSNEGSKAAAAYDNQRVNNVATVTVMSLTMLSVNSSKKQNLSSQAFHQTTVWSKSFEIPENKFFVCLPIPPRIVKPSNIEGTLHSLLSQRQLETDSK